MIRIIPNERSNTVITVPFALTLICCVFLFSIYSSLSSFSSVSFLVLEQRELVTLKRTMFFFIDTNSNSYSVSGIMRKNYRQWNRFKIIWGGLNASTWRFRYASNLNQNWKCSEVCRAKRFFDTLLSVILKFFIHIVFNSEEEQHSSTHKGVACLFFC